MNKKNVTDTDLLERYADDGSEDAFRKLVDRHTGMVYAACLRQLRDHHLAQDASQAVFITLAKKASKIKHKAAVGGWLYKTAVFVSLRVKRQEKRRMKREKEAEAMQKEIIKTKPGWEEIQPYIDRGLNSLPARLRNAVILYYMENRSQKETAQELGCTENAVKKRVARAIDKLRRIFRKQGVAVPAAALISMLAEKASEAAPEGIASSCHAAAMASIAGQAAAFGNAVLLSEGVIKMMMWIKIKTAAVCIASAAVLGGIAAPIAFSAGADEEKHNKVETAEGMLVNGLLFKPVTASRAWTVPDTGRNTLYYTGLKITNTRRKKVRLCPYSIDLTISSPDGTMIKKSGGRSRARLKIMLNNYPVIQPGESIFFSPYGFTPMLEKKGPGWQITYRDGSSTLWDIGPKPFGKYRAGFRYSCDTTSSDVWDDKTKKTVEVKTWTGTVQTDPVSVHIVRGLQGRIDRGDTYRNAVKNLGRTGFLAVRSESRRNMIQEELRKYGWNGKPDLLNNVDFTKEMVIMLFRSGPVSEDILVRSISGSKKELMIEFGLSRIHAFSNTTDEPLLKFSCFCLPVSDRIRAKIPGRTQKIITLQHGGCDVDCFKAVSPVWTIGPDGGDVADGLQGHIKAEKETIKPGEDIKVTFTLKAADLERKEPIYVWDAVYSMGYRNYAFMVKTPDGKYHFLRRSVQMAWDKNAPHLLKILPGSPYMLCEGHRGKAHAARSLKSLGLDTTQPGAYTICGVYSETGCYESPIGSDATIRWGGNIATNTVQVKVAPSH